MTRPTVPLVDLAWQHAQVAPEVEDGLAQVLAATDFIGGAAVKQFEAEYAAWSGVPHVVGVGNGTDAIELALRAVGVRPGHEVVLPAHTFVATAEAVVRCGAVPRLVDVDPEHMLIDVDQAIDAIGPRTGAVVPVHLYGQIGAIEPLLDAAAAASVPVVEDAAQAQGATRRGRPAGTLGSAAGTSFYPGKNLGAYGDAGAVLTWSPEVAERSRLLANHGERAKYDHVSVGFNSRLDTMQAVVLRAKLRRLGAWNDLRRAAAQRYADLLRDVPDVYLPSEVEGSEHVWHLYVVRVPARERVAAAMRAAGVGVGVHYPRPVHLHPAFAALNDRPGAFPVAEESTGDILSLPMYPGITADQQERVVDALCDAVAGRAA